VRQVLMTSCVCVLLDCPGEMGVDDELCVRIAGLSR